MLTEKLGNHSAVPTPSAGANSAAWALLGSLCVFRAHASFEDELFSLLFYDF
jgi:membrane associated rhomboid family serine protease